jgi:hypothetical protein
MGPSNRFVSTALNEGKRPLGKLAHRLEDDITVGRTEIWHGVESAGSEWAPVTY